MSIERPRPTPRIQSRTRGLAIGTVAGVIGLAGVIAVSTYVWRSNSESSEATSPDRFLVRRGDFDITVPASGELAALRQIEISSRLDERAAITFVVDEGISVKKGDVLIRLNDEDIKDRIKDAKDSVNTARNSWVTAKNNTEIRRQSNTSELSRAELEIKLADLAFEGWANGTDLSTRRKLQLEVQTTQKNHDRLETRFEASKELLANEFISQDEYQRDEIELMRAASSLEQAKIAVDVYEKYDYEQERAKLESDLEQARDRRDEITKRHENEIQSLETDVESKAYQLGSREERLEKLVEQLEMCTITAPQDGLVVYAASLQTGRYGRNERTPPTVGTELRRNEPVIILPDTSAMIAEVKVNEAQSGRIEEGQRATVMSDAVPDRPVTGEVIGVGVLAESGGWRDPNRRDYTVRIKLAGAEGMGLKPSMRCKASIHVGQVQDTVFVPVQAIFRQGRVAFTYVPDGTGYAQRPVTLGRASDLYIEVLEGLEEGDSVLLREPAPERITQSLPTEPSAPWGAMTGQRPGQGQRPPAATGGDTPRRAAPPAGAGHEGAASRQRGGPPAGVGGGERGGRGGPRGAEGTRGGPPASGGKPAGAGGGRPSSPEGGKPG